MIYLKGNSGDFCVDECERNNYYSIVGWSSFLSSFNDSLNFGILKNVKIKFR